MHERVPLVTMVEIGLAYHPCGVGEATDGAVAATACPPRAAHARPTLSPKRRGAICRALTCEESLSHSCLFIRLLTDPGGSFEKS